MELIRNIWTIADIIKLNKYLESFKRNNQIWTKNIYKTQKHCLAIPISRLRQISKEIIKGNYLQFIEKYFTCVNQNINVLNQIPIEFNLIIGLIICNINEINSIKKYLTMYGKSLDSWVETDVIKLKINSKNKHEIFKMSTEFLWSEFPFLRRLGIIIFFKYLNDKFYLSKIFKSLLKLYSENNYYVNMSISWLLCESFIKNKDKTLAFLHRGGLNRVVLQKFVSKCRDSFRVCKEDKEMLRQFISTKI